MRSFVDFIIDADDITEADRLGHIIFERLFLRRVKQNKPCIIVLVGDSGEGKSHTALRLMEIFSERQGFELLPYVNDCVIYTPLEYPVKFRALLEDPRLKHVNFVMLDEAREVVKASQWNSFINHAIADINATFRGIKPMVVIVVVQYLKDVDKRVRRTANYYGSCLRPMGHSVRLKLTKLWKDETDIENPRLRKRMVRGYIKSGSKYTKIAPKVFKISRVSKEVAEIYETNARLKKTELIRSKLDQLMKELQKDFGQRITRIEAAARHFGNNYDMERVLERYRGKLRVRPDFVATLDFDKDEIEKFQKLLLDEVKKRGLADATMVEQEQTPAK